MTYPDPNATADRISHELARLQAAVELVEALHVAADEPWCLECSNRGVYEQLLVPYPCPTIRALRGES